jgi:hypothetical protein
MAELRSKMHKNFTACSRKTVIGNPGATCL